jgi:L-threonylcarbamoyladenylate synthase
MTNIQKATEILKNGGVVVHPTDTCYGLAANAYDQKAIQKIYEIKGRDFNKPLILAVRDIDQLLEIADLTEMGKILFQKFFPGPLTLVLNKNDGSGTVGVRTPNHPVVLELLKLCDFPFTTTSANISGGKNPYSVSEINLPGVDFILDSGKLPENPPSTVVDVTGDAPVVLRAGPVSLEQIRMVLVAARR